MFVTDGDGRGQFKYSIENSIGVGSTELCLVPASGIYEPGVQAFADAAPAHLYAICTRPRLLMRPESFSRRDRTIEATWTTTDQNQDEVTWSVQLAPGYDLAPIRGGSEVQIFEEGEVVRTAPAATLLAECLSEGASKSDFDAIHERFLDLQVQYVGQAFGTNGERNAVTRLTEHSTFQRVLAQLDSGPGFLQSWVLLMGFNAQTNAMSFGPWSGQVSFEDSLERALSNLEAEIEPNQATNIAEASLIRYFQPHFNVIYKDSFPNEEHTTYTFPYELDVNSVTFGLETTGVNCRLTSDNVAPAWGHSAFFPLRPSSDRRAMLDLFTDRVDFIVAHPKDHVVSKADDKPSSA